MLSSDPPTDAKSAGKKIAEELCTRKVPSWINQGTHTQLSALQIIAVLYAVKGTEIIRRKYLVFSLLSGNTP